MSTPNTETPTPLTDAELRRYDVYRYPQFVRADFARSLERHITTLREYAEEARNIIHSREQDDDSQEFLSRPIPTFQPPQG